MASEFLRKKAQEQAEDVAKRYGSKAYGAATQKNAKPAVKKGEGASASSSGSTSSRASAFLRNKAQEQAKSVTEKYGEDAYGGVKWRNTRNSTLTKESLSSLQQRVKGLGTVQSAAANAPRTSGGYYSRTSAGGADDELLKSINALVPAMREFSAPVGVAGEELQEAERKWKIVNDYHERAIAAYQAAPSQTNAETYNKIHAVYEQTHRAYTEAYNKYSAVYTEYKTVEEEVEKILSAYQQYSDQQQAAFDEWRGTIRDEQAIQAEMEQLDDEIRQLESREGSLTTLTRFRNDALGQQMKQSLSGVQGELEQLRAERALLQEEYEWSQYYKYAELANASDFADKSRYVSTVNGKTRSAMDIMMGNYAAGYSGWDDPLYEFINGNKDAGAYISNAAASGYGSDNALGAVFGRTSESKTESQQMTEDEVATFNYLYATQGKEAAHAYYQYLQSDLNYRQRRQDEEYWADYAKRRPVLSSAFSTLISPAKGLAYIGQAVDLMEGGDIDQNAAYNKYSYAGSAIRGQVAQEIENSGKWGAVGSFAYQTGMSMADFLMNTAITGGSKNLSMAIMGTGAAADATIAAKDRGLSDEQSFKLGSIAGLAELAAERFSLEVLLKPSLLRNGSRQYVLKNMLTEGLEEAGTDIINLFADILISKDQSEWQQSIDAYVRNGKSEEEALGLAVFDQVINMGLDFLGGALSGGIMSGGAAIGFNKSTKQHAHQLDKQNLDMEDIQAFIDTGLESAQDSDAYHIAVELQQKIEAGEQISSYDLSRLQQANAQAIAEEEEQLDEPEGLRLRAVDDEMDYGTDEDLDAEADDEFEEQKRMDAHLTIAERLRREQIRNGGAEYEGEYVPDGSKERAAGPGAGEQARILAEGTEQRRKAYADTGRAAVARQNLARHLRLPKVSTQELGLQSGTEKRNIQVMPEENWDDEMSRVAGRIHNETGKTVTYVICGDQYGMRVRGAGGTVCNVRGVITDKEIIIQADRFKLSIEKIADHEAYHAKVDYAAENGLNLNAAIRQHIIEKFSEDEFSAVLDAYIVELRGIYDVNAARNREEYEWMVRKIEEELFADAYAGINFFGTNADRFTEAVNDKMGQYMLGKQTDQENGTEQPTGPPSDRYSIGSTADGRPFVTVDRDILAGIPEQEWVRTVKQNLKEKFPSGITVGDNEIRIDKRSREEMTYSGYMRWLKNADAQAYRDKLRATDNADEILLATTDWTTETPKHSRKDKIVEFATGNALIRIGENDYSAKVVVGTEKNGVMRLYDILDLRTTSITEKKKAAAIAANPSPGVGRNTATFFDNSLADNHRTVNGENSDERYSYAGRNANTADLDALEQAKEMEAWGVADETIRQQTGWHKGMDGLWRWEIDDSEMRYHRGGDAQFSEDHPHYARHQELIQKMIYGRLSVGEEHELRQLDELWGRERSRLSERVDRGNATLGDILRHDALFAAYPQLQKMRVRFDDLPDGVRGQMNREENTVTLNKTLRNAPEDTLIHEIQHAIQEAERFTGGASSEFWSDKRVTKPEYEAEIQKAKDSVREVEERFHKEWRDDINLNLAKQYVEMDRQYWAEEAEESVLEGYVRQMDLIEELADESGWRDLLDDYFYANGELQTAAMRAGLNLRTSDDLYRNTAGEIEARDVTARRRMDRETRRATRPAGADKNTVFAEDADDLSLTLGDQYSVDDDAYMEAVNSGDMRAAQRMVDEAAERWGAYLNNDEANEVFHQDGRVRTFYHGTNTGDFTTFDGGMLGSSSGDLGWFGKGFYFAFSYDEAATYGGRVIPAYLRMRKPFDYSQLYKFKGSDKGSSRYSRFAWVYNITKQFPDLAEGQRVWAYPNDAEEGTAVSWKQLTGWMDRVHKEKQFSVEEVEQSDGTTAWELRADPKKKSFTTDDGETFEWTEYGMRQLFATEQDAREPLNQVCAYLENMMGVESVPRRAIERIDFSGAVQRAGYDGILQSMSGDEAVVFSPEQIKTSEPVTYDDEGNVIPLSKRFDHRNPDIRYSVDDSEDQKNDLVQKKAKREQQARKDREKADERRSNVQKRIDAITESEEKKLKTADKPARAKRNLKRNLLDQFSIPSGKRGEMSSMIDAYAERLIQNGRLLEDDRKHLFDRLYESGVMTEQPNEYFAEARAYMKGGRIYVPDRVVHDFGDDWNDIRKRAFAAGIYLTRSQTRDGHSTAGIDMWNHDLATELPGLFDSEETDERAILERIVQVAEEGKEERLSLPEYTARLAGEGFIDPEAYMIEMERRVDWALRAFASEAELEVDLKQRFIRDTAAARKQSIRQRAKMAEERDNRREMARRQQDRKELQELQKRTLKQLQWLAKNRHRAPEEQKAAWDEVLSDIDLYAVGAANEMQWSNKYEATWQDLAQMYKDAKEHDPNFMPSKELERIVTRLDGRKIADMDLGALQDLYKAAIGLRTEFHNRNNVINDKMQRLFAEVYTDSKREIESAPGGFTGGIADKFLNMDQLTPMNVMQRMAGWNPDGAFYSMAKQLEQGERDMRAYSVKAQRILRDFLTENEDWVKKADGQGKDAIWYEVEVPQLLELEMGDAPIFGPTVKVYMTPAQKVHMYLESKNMDNLRHMTGGRTFVHKELYSQGKRQEAMAQGRTIRLAPETVKKLVSDLTPTEMELARILDQYYNTFATQEINRVSNILYGYDKAMGKNYAPIYTNQNYTKTEFGVFDVTAEGVGNLKGRQYAVNPSYNISAFDAFERHIDQTARFCGMAIPARNWTNLMNWRERDNSTADVISHKWGNEGKKYIEDLITTLQAGDDVKTDTISSLAQKAQSNYISAIFGANPSIVLKQLGSIPLAGAYLDAKNMPTPAQMFGVDRDLISKYTQELEWRTMGYTTPETKALKENPNWTQTNKTFKFIFGGGAITAMDGWAASTLWPWAENKVRREYPDLEIGTREQIEAGESPFYRKVAEEFNEAVCRSQSVSDEIHQGRLRKSKNPITRAFTLFRSDSAQTYNTLRQKIGEAQYYMRSGAKEKVQAAAKKAVGTAFMALLVNAAWGEAINFLMALWKNKGKHYRDDDEELTAMSVTGEMVSGMLGSFSGVVTGGEEVLDVVGNILTGEKIYDIETPGMEQINDIIKTVTEAGGDMRELVAGGWDIVQNGGDLGAYFGDNAGQILASIKELAVAAATYLPGLPVINLEAYLVGTLKWISPELGAAYDDLFDDVGKADLAKTEGKALATRIGGILGDRKISDSDDTAEALAALYEAGYREAVPGDIPTSISVKGESRKLGVYQQQSYGMIWSSVVSSALDDLVSSGAFEDADEKTKAKMLNSLYSYAAEQAKAELFDDYEMDTGAAENEAIVDAGATVAECIAWNALTTGKNPDGTAKMKAYEKAAELARWDLPYAAKREIFRAKISDSREDTVNALMDTGMSFNQILRAYSKYSEVNGMDIQASQKAVEFSHWVNDQGYEPEQAAAVKDEMTYFNMTPASASRYDGMVAAGMDADDAYGLTGVLGELMPDEGEESVTDLQKWRASVDYFADVEDQLTALSMVMPDNQFVKVEIANDFGVTPDAYIMLQEIKPRYDADRNGSYKQTEIKAAIDSMGGRYTTEQKAVLWQLTTGSTSSKNNPYSRQVGQRVLNAREAAKNAAKAEADDEDYSFSKAVMDQLLGRG